MATVQYTRQCLLVAITNHRLPYYQYKLLAEWLDCYEYILPDDRCLAIYPTRKPTCSRDVIRMWQVCDTYESFTREEQLMFSSLQGRGITCVI